MKQLLSIITESLQSVTTTPLQMFGSLYVYSHMYNSNFNNFKYDETMLSNYLSKDDIVHVKKI